MIDNTLHMFHQQNQTKTASFQYVVSNTGHGCMMLWLSSYQGGLIEIRYSDHQIQIHLVYRISMCSSALFTVVALIISVGLREFGKR